MKKNTHVLTKEDVLHLAELSSLVLTDEEINKLLGQLNETLDYVENLHELKTDAISSEATHITKTTSVYSEDEVDTSRMLTQEQALQNAPSKKKHYFVVKRIL